MSSSLIKDGVKITKCPPSIPDRSLFFDRWQFYYDGNHYIKHWSPFGEYKSGYKTPTNGGTGRVMKFLGGKVRKMRKAVR